LFCMGVILYHPL